MQSLRLLLGAGRSNSAASLSYFHHLSCLGALNQAWGSPDAYWISLHQRNFGSTAKSADPGSRTPAAAAAEAAAEDTLQLPAGELSSDAAEALTGPVSAVISVIDGLHAVSGLPWWATLAATAVGVRLATLPLSLLQMRASAAVMPLLRQAQQRAAGDGTAQQAAMSASWRHTAAEFHALRRQHGAPHPAWIVAAPLVQLPVFITTLMAVRRMAATPWPGLESGGTLWFNNLCAPALDFSTLAAPLGPLGIALPAAVVVAMLVNIDLGFGPLQKQGGGVGGWVAGTLRLVLEWLTVPLFVIALQLPQGALCYWLASGVFGIGQHLALRTSAMRSALSLPSAPLHQPPHQQAASAPLSSEDAQSSNTPEGGKVAAADDSAASPGSAPQMSDAAAAELLARAESLTDVSVLFIMAADLRAGDQTEAAIIALHRILTLRPGHARAEFALGQCHAALKQWGAAQKAYLRAADAEEEQHQRGRAWFGAGIALQMQGEHLTALDALAKAAALAGRSETALRAFMAQASIHRQGGQLQEALQAVRSAADIDPKIRSTYVAALEKEVDAQQGT